MVQDENQTSNNSIELYSRVPLSDEQIEILQIYLENKRMSGGGELKSFESSESRRMFLVEFISSEAKKRVLERKCLKYSDFEVFVNMSLSHINSKLDDRCVILNVDCQIDEFVQMYAENLINFDAKNRVESIVRSHEIPNTFYVKFKQPIDQHQLFKRIQRRPHIMSKFDFRPVRGLNAFQTHAIVVKIPEVNENLSVSDMRESIELLFSNKKRCGADKFEMSIFRDPYIIIVYSSEDECRKVADREYSLLNQKLPVERLYNFTVSPIS